MDYPGDVPPSPEERAGVRLSANAAWLEQSKEQRAQERERPITLRDGRLTTSNQLDAEMIRRSDQKAVAAARKSIEAERKAHKCFICGRKDLPRWSRFFAVLAALLLGVFAYASDRLLDATIFGYVGVAAAGAAVAAKMYESIKPEEEAEIREKFNGKPHN
jgi:hypothetical protein